MHCQELIVSSMIYWLTLLYLISIAPSAAPVSITTEAMNSTQIKVKWEPPPTETHNGELSGYKVLKI